MTTTDPTACDRTDMPSDPDALCSNCGQRADAHAGWLDDETLLLAASLARPWGGTVTQDES